MDRQALEALIVEMAGHLQAALTAIEVVLMGQSADAMALSVAREEIVASWRALEIASAASFNRPSRNGHGGPRGDGPHA